MRTGPNFYIVFASFCTALSCSASISSLSLSFFFNGTATTEIYTLSLHDALPIFHEAFKYVSQHRPGRKLEVRNASLSPKRRRSEEHTSELQSLRHLVCRLLLEKKNEKERKVKHLIFANPK